MIIDTIDGATDAAAGGPSPASDEHRRISFEVPGDAQPQGSHKVYPVRGRFVVAHDNPRLRPWRDTVAWHARAEMAGRPPMAGPVAVELTFRYQRPKGHFGKRGLRPSAPTDHVVKPDIDRLARAALDALTQAGVWRDDAQVVCVVALKRYADRSGATVVVERAETAPGWAVLRRVN